MKTKILRNWKFLRWRMKKEYLIEPRESKKEEEMRCYNSMLELMRTKILRYLKFLHWCI